MVKVLNQKRTIRLEVGFLGQHLGAHSVTHREHVESLPTDQKQVVGRVVAVLGDQMLAVVASWAPC